MKVKFEVPGPPKGKQRPRVVRNGGFTRTYTPKETVMYENLVKMCYLEQVGRVMLTAPIALSMTAYFPIPKSTSKKQHARMASGNVFHTKRPDIDNCIKSILDGMSGISYHDDAAIAEIRAKKAYSDNPRVEVTLEELGDE